MRSLDSENRHPWVFSLFRGLGYGMALLAAGIPASLGTIAPIVVNLVPVFGQIGMAGIIAVYAFSGLAGLGILTYAYTQARDWALKKTGKWAKDICNLLDKWELRPEDSITATERMMIEYELQAKNLEEEYINLKHTVENLQIENVKDAMKYKSLLGDVEKTIPPKKLRSFTISQYPKGYSRRHNYNPFLTMHALYKTANLMEEKLNEMLNLQEKEGEISIGSYSFINKTGDKRQVTFEELHTKEQLNYREALQTIEKCKKALSSINKVYQLRDQVDESELDEQKVCQERIFKNYMKINQDRLYQTYLHWLKKLKEINQHFFPKSNMNYGDLPKPNCENFGDYKIHNTRQILNITQSPQSNHDSTQRYFYKSKARFVFSTAFKINMNLKNFKKGLSTISSNLDKIETRLNPVAEPLYARMYDMNRKVASIKYAHEISMKAYPAYKKENHDPFYEIYGKRHSELVDKIESWLAKTTEILADILRLRKHIDGQVEQKRLNAKPKNNKILEKSYKPEQTEVTEIEEEDVHVYTPEVINRFSQFRTSHSRESSMSDNEKIPLLLYPIGGKL